jgi:S1-C subfamily serine protease
VRRGDILIRVGEHEIRSVEDLAFVLRAQKPGDRVTLVLLRDGKEVRVEAVLQERPPR